jgi:hypothetical protein
VECDKCAMFGYEFARSGLGLELTDQEQEFHEKFQPCLQQKFGVTTVTSWAKLIMLSCHDEKTGFEHFFKLLDEFNYRKDSNSQAA